MLVFTLYLEKVEEVCGACVYLDEVLVWSRRGVREGRDGEVGGTTDVFFYLDGFHSGRGG